MTSYDDERAKYQALIEAEGGSVPASMSLSDLIDVYVGLGISKGTDLGGATPGGGAGGVTVHNELTGRELDGHTQYHTDARGDARYYLKAEVDSAVGTRAPSSHAHSISVSDLSATGTKDATTFLRGDNTFAVPAGGGGVTDHGALTGLLVDDHTQYLNETRGDARYYTQAQVNALTYALNDLTDVDTVTATPQVGDTLEFNGTNFVPAVPATNTDAGNLTTGNLNIERLPAGSVLNVDYVKSGGINGNANAWPASRPTARTDITVIWTGPTSPGVIAIAGDKIDYTG